MAENPIDKLLEIIERQIIHEESGWTKKYPQTNYSRGFVKGIKWTKSEIMKIFGRRNLLPNEVLKVKGKQRTIDDTKDGLVYKLSLTKKEGKRGEPGYRKWSLVFEEGTSHIYDRYEPEELIRVSVDSAHRKLDEFQEEP